MKQPFDFTVVISHLFRSKKNNKDKMRVGTIIANPAPVTDCWIKNAGPSISGLIVLWMHLDAINGVHTDRGEIRQRCASMCPKSPTCNTSPGSARDISMSGLHFVKLEMPTG
jgi:hypothetical protein